MAPRDARERAREQWSKHPAGTTLVNAPDGTREFFDALTASRYREQPWHPDLLRRFGARGRLLEIGSGAGTDHAELAKTAEATVAVDLTQRGAFLTQQRLRLEGRHGAAVVTDAEAMPFQEGVFDCVYSFGVIHHTDNPPRVSAEMLRVMRPGAKFLVALYHRHSLFVLYKIIEFLVTGAFLRRSWASFFGLIEAGADELDQPPKIGLYSRRQAARLFRHFAELETELVHVGVPLPWFGDWLGRHFGWYVVVRGRKPQSAS